MTAPEEQRGAGLRDAFERLYTPHRMAYIAGEGKGPECPFCEIPGMADSEGLVVARGEECFVVLNLYPYNSGHLMVVPYRHVSGYDELTDHETVELAELT
ncbi:MAG: diadenosine tetraphosphate hydrolase, partial [Mycobacteriales bacterium]